MLIWIPDDRKCWRASYYDRNGILRFFTLDFHKSTHREEVLAEVIPDAATEYFYLLHRQGIWKKLEIRNRSIQQMFQRMVDFQPVYTIEEFAYELGEIGIKPALAKEVIKAKKRVRRVVKNRTKRNRTVDYRGMTKTVPEWATWAGIPARTLNMRLTRGWEIARALTTPVMTQSEGGIIGADRRWKRRKHD